MAERKRIIAGDVFHRLTAMSDQIKNDPYMMFRCECGVEKSIYLYHVRYGKTTSCGCRSKEMSSSRARTHGATAGNVKRPSEYVIWILMKRRCFDASSRGYMFYGARGITVCPRWMKFENFIADVGPRPTKQHSIDRIDNGGNYEPGNVRWATKKEQMRNTRKNTFWSFNGQTHCIAAWAEITGISALQLSKRVRRGWSVQDALTKPLRKWPTSTCSVSKPR